MNNVQRYFDTAGRTYARRSNGGLWKTIREFEWKAVQRFLKPSPLGDVLEWGCGSGFYTRKLKQWGCQRLVAVDFSKAMLDELYVESCTKIQADIEQYRDGTHYDLIFCGGALEFVNDPQSLFSNAASMLKPEGRFMVLAPRASVLGFCYGLYHRRHQITIRYFSATSLQEYADKAGLHLTNICNAFPFSLVATFAKGKVPV